MVKNITCSTLFITPLFGIGSSNLEKYGFKNAYLDDLTSEIRHENCIYLLFKPETLESFWLFLQELRDKNKYILEDYDYDGGYIVVVMDYSKLISESDIELFLNGKYSRMSNSYKNKIPKVKKIVNEFGMNKDELSLQWRIFKRSNDLKEYWEKEMGVKFGDNQEYWPAPDFEKEILDIEQLK